MPATQTATTSATLSALDRFSHYQGGPLMSYVVDQMKGLHRIERKRKFGWRM
jgi:hypothetical protein